ncbi:hypothetical protein D9M71_293580 [compost metagenome]
MDDAVLVGTETHLTSFRVLHSGSYVRGNGANFRVRHQAARTEDLAQLTDDTHCVRGSDDHVVVQVAGFHFCSQFVHANLVCTSSQGSFSARTLSEDSYANALAGAVRQHGGATYNLVGFTRIDAQVDGDINGLFELDGRQLGQQFGGIFESVLLASFYFLGDSLLTLGQLSHYTPSTLRPMLRAEPAMVRTAASRSAAVRSACLALAISSS